MVGVRKDGRVCRMQVDLRLAKGKRLSPSTERDRCHTKNHLIEADCFLYVSHREYEVIEAVNLHSGLPGLTPKVLGEGPPERRRRGGNLAAQLAGGPSRPAG